MMDVFVCRGCCCGTTKHPDVDHDAHLAALRTVAPDLETTPCLGPCRWSNVVVAVTDDGTQHWFTKVLDDDALAAVTTWLAEPSVVPAAPPGPRPGGGGTRPSGAANTERLDSLLDRVPPRPDRSRVELLVARRRSLSPPGARP